MGGRVRVTGDPEEGREPVVGYSAPSSPAKGKPVKVTTDTLVERPDLGRGAVTFVARGDDIPSTLTHFPRRASIPARKARGRKLR